MGIMKYIQGSKFWEMADHILMPDVYGKDDYYKLANTMGNVKEGDVIYTHTMYKNSLLDFLNHIKTRVVIVTHNHIHHLTDTPPDNVIAWYSKNAMSKDCRVHPIPIGLENDRWFTIVNKVNVLYQYNDSCFDRNNLLYVNHNVATNPTERRWAYEKLHNKEWATVVKKGHHQKDFEAYVKELKKHMFVLSPPGTGIDCHRTWEGLYTGCIPIIKSGLYDSMYKDLPVMIVNNWDEVTKESLEKFYAKHLKKDYNYNKLTFKYWRDLIWDSKKK